MMKMYRAWNPNFGEAILAAILSVIGYFSPVKGIIHMLLVFFMLDIIFGYWKDWKVNKAGFNPSIIWDKTIPRMVVTMVLLLCAFTLDEKTSQGFVDTYRIAGWIIGALLLVSIGENGYHITRWRVFWIFGILAKKKIEKELGIKIDEKDLK